VIERSSMGHSANILYRARHYRTALSFLIAVALLILIIGRADATLFERVRIWMIDQISYGLEFVSSPVTSAMDYVRRSDEFFQLYEENQKLKTENQQMREWRDAALKLERTVESYQALLNVSVDPSISFVTSRVIADSGGPFVRALIVNAGTADGIKDKSAVIDSHGLVGRIVATGARASRVLLLGDLNSRIPVTIHPGNHRAVLAGNNSPMPILEYVDKEVTLSVGNRVVTSGSGGLLPPGLPIGLIDASGIEDGIYRVRPFSDPSLANFVRVLKYDFPLTVEPEVEEAASSEEIAEETGDDATGSVPAVNRAAAPTAPRIETAPAAAAPARPVQPAAPAPADSLAAPPATTQAAAPTSSNSAPVVTTGTDEPASRRGDNL